MSLLGTAITFTLFSEAPCSPTSCHPILPATTDSRQSTPGDPAEAACQGHTHPQDCQPPLIMFGQDLPLFSEQTFTGGLVISPRALPAMCVYFPAETLCVWLIHTHNYSLVLSPEVREGSMTDLQELPL